MKLDIELHLNEIKDLKLSNNKLKIDVISTLRDLNKEKLEYLNYKDEVRNRMNQLTYINEILNNKIDNLKEDLEFERAHKNRLLNLIKEYTGNILDNVERDALEIVDVEENDNELNIENTVLNTELNIENIENSVNIEENIENIEENTINIKDNMEVNIEENIEFKKEENTEMCNICYVRKIDHVINCGHKYCYYCVSLINDCAYCRTSITSRTIIE